MKKLLKRHRVLIKIRQLFIPDGPYGDRQRGKLYEPFLKSYGENFKVASNSFIYNPNNLTVGDHVYIGFNSYLGQGEIELGNEVLIGNFVSITASNHLMKNNSYRFGGFESKKITIGAGSWIGAHACILAGISLGDCCLVAAGCVVTKSHPQNSVLQGVPAKIFKK